MEDRILLSALGTPSLVEGPAAGSDTDTVIVSGAWTASTSTPWITVNTTSGTGNGSVNFSFAADAGATRSGTVTIAGQTLTVTQAGAGYVAAGMTSLVPSVLDGPTGVAVDASGNVFIADAYHDVLKEWHSATGTVTTIGSGGLALNNNAAGLALDSSGNVYIPDSNGVKKWVAATGTITSLVSVGLSQPYGVAVDASGNVYIADSGNNAIKEWHVSTGTVTTLVSTGIGDPTDVAVDGSGNVYFSDTNNNAIKEWQASSGTVITLVSNGFSTLSGVAVDGSGNVYFADSYNNVVKEWHVASGTVTTLVSAGLNVPAGLALDASGNVYIASVGNNQIDVWHQATGTVTTLVSSVLAFPKGAAVDSSGNAYIADPGNNAIKEWNAATGAVTTLATAGLQSPSAVAVDGAGNVYIADTGNSAIKEWHVGTGTVTTLVSSGLSQPYGVAVDSVGNVYIADLFNSAIKEWTLATGTVTTLVSTGLSYPLGVAVDGAGNVFIADSSNNAVKEWHVATATVTTVVSAGLNYPWSVAVDGSGNIYIADRNNFLIKEWNAATGTVSTIVSSGLYSAAGVAADSSGNVFIADTYNSELKELPRAYVNTTAKAETSGAGTDQLGVVVPSTANLAGVFAPTSDQSWLTIGSVSNGVVNFNFSANVTSAARTAHITLLGQTIAVTQAVAPPVSLGATSLVEGPSAGSDSDIVVTTGAWTASTTASWITVNTTSGTGNGVVNFSFAADPGATRSGTVTIAGQTLTVTQSGAGYVAAGPTTLVAATLTSLYGVAVDSAGNVYMADHNNNSIKEWHVGTGATTTLVSSGLNNPLGVAVDSAGNVYIADSQNSAIKEWHAATGVVTTLVSGLSFPQAVALDGSGNVYFDDANAVKEWQAATGTVTTITSGGNPYGVAVDGSGNVYIADGGTPSIKEWHAATGTVTTIFSTGSGGNTGVAVDAAGNVYFPDGNNNAVKEWHVSGGAITTLVSAGLVAPKCLAIDASGNVYIASTGNNTVQEWKQSTGAVTTLVSSVVAYPNGVAVDSSGNVYIADTGNSAIKEWHAATGTVTTLASTGLNPYGVAVDGAGNVYIADGANNAIKEWHVATGSVTTLVSAGLSNPTGVAVDGAGNVYIADTYNFAIKEWQVSSGTVTTLVSTGLSYPSGVSVDAAGNVYFADSGNNAVKEWHVSTGSVTTLVSSGLNYPYGVAVDGSGNVYIGDANNNAIKVWNAVTGTVTAIISTGLKDPDSVALDSAGNIYVADWNSSDLKELPRAYLNTNLKLETSGAGTDQLSVVVPSTANLTGVFGPTSDQNWLTFGSLANDVVNFNFSSNPPGASRTAHITLLGQTISVTQTATPMVTTPAISSIANTSAVLGGNVTNDGGQTITERGILYALTSVNPNPQLGGTGVTKVTATGTTGAFTVNALGLTQGSVYSFVAYATNSNGTTYSPLGPTFVPGPVNVTGVYDPASNPIAAGSTLSASPNSLSASFSENMNTVSGGVNSVTNPSNWLLFRYGVDVSYQITGITFAQNPTSLQYLATLSFATPLTQGGYQLIARQSIQDITGRSLSGSAGSSPIDFRLNFYVGQTVGGTTDVAPYLYNIEPVALNAPATVATPITSSLYVFDADSTNWTSATVQIAINYQSGEDVLNFSNAATPNITASWNAATGTLTLSGTDTVSDYRTALHNVTFTDTSATPNTALTRTVYFQANDGLLLSNLQTRDVTVMASSIPAVLSGVNGTGTYFQGYPAIFLAPSLVITDPNTINLSSATVSFTNWQGEDRLNFNNIFADQWTFTQDLVAHTATFTITGADMVDHYQTLLRSVIYWDVSGAPVTSARVASFSVTDGLSTSNIVTRNTIVAAVNQPPALNNIESTPLFCKANDPAYPAQPISNTLLVGDPDSNNLTKATVQITSGYENDANGTDVLAFTNQLGITGSFNAATGTMTLTGTSSVSNYRTALRSVTFGTSGAAPSTAARTLTIYATDDYTPTPATSLSATRSVTVQTTNLPPALSNIPNAPLAYVRNAAATAIAPGAVIYDPDSINLAGATIQVSGNYQSGLDVLAATVVTGITQSFNATNGTLTLSGISSLANYQTVLQSVTFQTTSAANTLPRTISFVLNDGLTNSSTVTRGVTLT